MKFADLLPYVLPEVVGCTDLLAERALRDTLIDLCLRAKVWSEPTYQQTTVPGQADYDIDLPCCGALVEIKWLAVDGRRLNGGYDDTAAIGASPGCPRAYTQLTPDTVTLLPAPEAALPLTMRLTLRPKRDDDTFPDWLGDRYLDAIVAGAKGRLLTMIGRAWSAPQPGAMYLASYGQEVARAMYDTAHGTVRGPLRTTPQH